MSGFEGAQFTPRHFLWEMRGDVGLITLNRPEKKNPLTFDSYAELRDIFRGLVDCDDVRAVVVTGRLEYLARAKEIGQVYRELMGKHFPAMSMVEVSALIEDRARVEIETTAVV